MKLYYSPGACSMSPNIVAHELGTPLALVKVDLKTKLTEHGDDYKAISPKGYVPALQLDDGLILTEGPAIVQYLADCKPEAGLAPAAGTMERYRLIETLNFVSTELHKTIGSLFNAAMPEAWRELTLAKIAERLDEFARELGPGDYLFGVHFSVADAYAFTVINWLRPLKFGLDRWPNVAKYMERVAARPAVKAAMASEGLLKGA